jgi:hypothetical protein|uniref:Uncharacterized protein n=1 Tax=Populus trichocarpa TaxID=3694 RepID=A0A2K1R466_POPTR
MCVVCNLKSTSLLCEYIILRFRSTVNITVLGGDACSISLHLTHAHKHVRAQPSRYNFLAPYPSKELIYRKVLTLFLVYKSA